MTVSEEPDQDLCTCDHVRFIHRPKCEGKYADGKWVKNPKRDCNCEGFVLAAIYKGPEACLCCGRVFDDSDEYIKVEP